MKRKSQVIADCWGTGKRPAAYLDERDLDHGRCPYCGLVVRVKRGLIVKHKRNLRIS